MRNPPTPPFQSYRVCERRAPTPPQHHLHSSQGTARTTATFPTPGLPPSPSPSLHSSLSPFIHPSALLYPSLHFSHFIRLSHHSSPTLHSYFSLSPSLLTQTDSHLTRRHTTAGRSHEGGAGGCTSGLAGLADALGEITIGWSF